MPCVNTNPNSTICLPMGQETNRTPKIKVIFRGFVISRIKHHMRAMVGAIDPAIEQDGHDSRCHQPNIHIYKIDANGVTTEFTGFVPRLDLDFYLDVDNSPSIEVFQKDEEPFNRLDEVENNKKDFRWVVDFNEIHCRTSPTNKVEILEAKLKPKFNLNSGVFHASKLSDGEVIIRRPNTPRPAKRFGRFATEITARIVLVDGNRAVLKNGESELAITSGDPYRWEILFDCTCRHAKELESDFSLIYEVVKDRGPAEIPREQKVSLDPREVDPKTEAESSDSTQTRKPTDDRKTPEVYCFGGNG